MKPFVIVARVRGQKELKNDGYDESNAILTFQMNAFMTTTLFELSATTVFFPTASDNSTQPLDLLTFALLKQNFSASRFNQLASPQSNQHVRTLGAWFAASAPHHNAEAFMSVGLIPVEREGRFFLTVVREQAGTVRGSAAVVQAGRIFPPDARGRFRLPTGI
jgi:hypothetical protein